MTGVAATPGIPPPLEEDDDDVAWALQTAAVQWERQAYADAIEWLRRAGESALDNGHAARASELNRAADELTEAVLGQAADSYEPPPPEGSVVIVEEGDLESIPPGPASRGSGVHLEGPASGSRISSGHPPNPFLEGGGLLWEDDDDDGLSDIHTAPSGLSDDGTEADAGTDDAERASGVHEPSQAPPPPRRPPFLAHRERASVRPVPPERGEEPPDTPSPPPPSEAESSPADEERGLSFDPSVPAEVEITHADPAGDQHDTDPGGAVQTPEPAAPEADGSEGPDLDFRQSFLPEDIAEMMEAARSAPVQVDVPEAAAESESSAVESEPPAVELEPPAVELEPPAVELEPPAADSEPPSLTSEPPGSTSSTAEHSGVTEVTEPTLASAREAVPAPPDVPVVELVQADDAGSPPKSGPPASVSVGGVSLAEVSGLEDLPDDAQAELARRAQLVMLGVDEEVSSFAVALVLRGWVAIMPSIADSACAHAKPGDVVFTQGNLDEGVALRVVGGQDGTMVAIWDADALAEATSDCPWVDEELREVADRFQALAGAAMGDLGDRLDDSLRFLVTDRCSLRSLLPGEMLFDKGGPVRGLFIVGAGRIEISSGDGEGAEIEEELGPGDFVFGMSVLSGSPAPAVARAGARGALLLVAPRHDTHELMAIVPPLIEIISG